MDPISFEGKAISLFLIALSVLGLFFFTLPANSETLSSETITELRQLKRDILKWAPRCADGTITFHECPFGDAMEYTGMLCLSGDEEYCDYARKSQGPDGMFWRSPGFIVSEDQPLTRDNEFSRDMAMGVFAYLVATKDTEAATRWIDYIDSNDNKLCMPNHDKDKPPETCATRAGFWATAMEVWDYLGLEYSSRMKGFKRTLINVYSPIELAVEPINSEITLPMDWIYIMEEIQRRSGGSTGPEHLTTKQVRILAHRMPDSPIVRFLAEGPNQQSADDLMRYCARQKPIGRRLDEHGVPIYNWIWDHHLDNPAYIENSTGWDCILLINMMISANQEKV